MKCPEEKASLINHKRTERLYQEERLQIKSRRRKKTAATLQVPMPYPEGMNQRWAMDFMIDNHHRWSTIPAAQHFDVFNRECLAKIVDTSINGRSVRFSTAQDGCADYRM
jgi:putative transposase